MENLRLIRILIQESQSHLRNNRKGTEIMNMQTRTMYRKMLNKQEMEMVRGGGIYEFFFGETNNKRTCPYCNQLAEGTAQRIIGTFVESYHYQCKHCGAAFDIDAN